MILQWSKRLRQGQQKYNSKEPESHSMRDNKRDHPAGRVSKHVLGPTRVNECQETAVKQREVSQPCTLWRLATKKGRERGTSLLREDDDILHSHNFKVHEEKENFKS